MITAISAEPPVAGNNLGDYRQRTQMAERPMLRDAAPSAPENSSASNNGQFEQTDRQPSPQPELPQRDFSTMFAAAVIAGTLRPTPQTMEQLIQRIGLSTIPEESEARLKDLLV